MESWIPAHFQLWTYISAFLNLFKWSSDDKKFERRYNYSRSILIRILIGNTCDFDTIQTQPLQNEYRHGSQEVSTASHQTQKTYDTDNTTSMHCTLHTAHNILSNDSCINASLLMYQLYHAECCPYQYRYHSFQFNHPSVKLSN